MPSIPGDFDGEESSSSPFTFMLDWLCSIPITNPKDRLTHLARQSSWVVAGVVEIVSHIPRLILVSKHKRKGANFFMTYAFNGFVDGILVVGFGLDTDWP